MAAFIAFGAGNARESWVLTKLSIRRVRLSNPSETRKQPFFHILEVFIQNGHCGYQLGQNGGLLFDHQ